jgi:uncharacterized DUF497 family protein
MFGWDQDKRAENALTHGVDFFDAMHALEDPNRIEREDNRHDYGEKRIQVIGRVGRTCYFIVFTERRDPPPPHKWIISARIAEPREERQLGLRHHHSGWRRPGKTG